MFRVNKYTAVCYLFFVFIFQGLYLNAQTFSPADIPGLKLWINGDSVESTNPPLIDRCYDLSTENNHAAQSTIGLLPVSTSSILNGHKILRFDGTDDYLAFNQILDIRTVFWVVLEDSDAAGGYIPMLGNGSTLDFLGEQHLIWGNGYASGYVTNGVTRLNSVQINGTITNRPNQFSVISVVTTANVAAGSFSKDRGNPERVWDGDLAELIIYNQPLSADQVDSVEQYLYKKFGNTVQLPDNRVVCSFPLTIKPDPGYFKNYLWQDNSTGDSIIVNGPGTYYLTATDVFNRVTSDTVIITGDLGTFDVFLGNDTSICFGDQLSLLAGPAHYSYSWVNLSSSSNMLTVDTSGSFICSVEDCTGNISTDTITIGIISLPVFSLGNDTIICSNTSFNLDPGFTNSTSLTFDWNDNTHDSIHNITANGQYFLTVSDMAGCSFSDTVNMQIDATNTNVFLGPDTTLCSGNIITLVSGNGPGLIYQWNDNSVNDSLTITISGEYIISVTNGNNCIDRDTINVSIAGQAPLAGFENSLACGNSSVSFIDTSFALGGNTITNWFWDFGDPNATDDSSIVEQPSYTFADTGSYSIDLTVITNVGCKQRIIKTIYVYPSPTVSLGSDTTLCGGNSITPVSTSGSGLTYLWNGGSTNDSLTVNAAGQYSIIVTNDDNCIAKDTINVVVPGFAPTANFLNSLTCQNNIVTFTDNSTPPSGDVISTWNWDFGDTTILADTSLLQNTFYTYTDTGNYTVSLIVETNVGCKHTFNKNIHVAPVPAVNFSNIIACKNDSALFVNSSSSPNYAPLSYLWDFGDPTSPDNTSTLLNPSHTFSNQTTYPVKLVTTNNAGCKDSLTKNISVKAQVSADFNYSTPCTNAPIVFQDNSIVPNPNSSNIRTWTIGASTLNGLSISQSFPSPGTYIVKLTVNGFNGCNSSMIKTINVMLPPTPQFTVNSVCLNDTLKPIDQSIPQNGILSSWNWQLDNVSFSSDQNTFVVPLTSGNHSIELVVSNAFGCKDSVTKPVNVFALPSVDFTTNPANNIYVGFPVDFLPTNPGGTLYEWTIADTLYTSQNVTHTFDTTGTYSATLYMKDNNGCVNTSSKSFLVRNRVLDLAVLDIRTSIGNDDYITIEADLANYGTVPVSGFELSCYITDASPILETWTGTPGSSSFFTHTFSSKIKQLQKNSNYITCVNIESVNNVSDSDPNNDKLCVTSNLGSTSVSDPFPNPAKDNMVLPIVLTKESKINFVIVDLLGKVIGETQVIQGGVGLNLISVPTIGLDNGQYILNVLIDDKAYIKKFTKLNQF